MQGGTTLIIGVAVVAYAAIARRLDSTPVSGPMLFVGLGVLLGDTGSGWLGLELSASSIRMLVEATLAVVLFSDASRVDLANLRKHLALPGRLLAVGLPLSIAFGVLAALGLLHGIPWEGALLVGIMLAPTDAALGQAVVTDPSVPVYVRQGLNVESGLNDGIVFPVFEIAVTVALVGLEGVEAGSAVATLAREIAFGALAGALVGATCGRVLSWSRRHSWTGRHWHGIATLGIMRTSAIVSRPGGGAIWVYAFTPRLRRSPSRPAPRGARPRRA